MPFMMSVISLEIPIRADVEFAAAGDISASMTLSSGGADASSLTSTVEPGISDDIAPVLTRDQFRRESAILAWCFDIPRCWRLRDGRETRLCMGKADKEGEFRVGASELVAASGARH